MGVAPPPARGRVSSNPPEIHAGNLDNKELVAGTTLFIPVHVPGALFEVGDGHAAQGDGEVDQTAIETSLRGRVQLTVRKGMTLTWPRAETPTHYISMGTDLDLTKATRIAIQEMVDFLAATKKHGQAHGVSADEHRRRRRDHAAGRRHDGRARQDAEEHLQEVAGTARMNDWLLSVVWYSSLLAVALALLGLLRPLLRLHLTLRPIPTIVLGIALLTMALLIWLAPGNRTIAAESTALDHAVPTYQFREFHTRTIDAPPDRVRRALKDVTAGEIALFQLFTTLRRLGRSAPESI